MDEFSFAALPRFSIFVHVRALVETAKLRWVQVTCVYHIDDQSRSGRQILRDINNIEIILHLALPYDFYFLLICHHDRRVMLNFCRVQDDLSRLLHDIGLDRHVSVKNKIANLEMRRDADEIFLRYYIRGQAILGGIGSI